MVIASASSVPSMSASPLTSNEPASSSPVSVILRKDAASLLLSTTTALEAATVPAVIPSSISSSASVNSAPEPNVSVPVTVRLSPIVTSEVPWPIVIAVPDTPVPIDTDSLLLPVSTIK